MRTFQKTSLFGGRSALDNILIGLELRAKQTPLQIMLGMQTSPAAVAAITGTTRTTLEGYRFGTVAVAGALAVEVVALHDAGEPLALADAGDVDPLSCREHVGREQLLQLLHGSAEEAFDRSIDVVVSRLRHKVEDDPRNPRMLKTIRGAGYMLTPGDR